MALETGGILLHEPQSSELLIFEGALELLTLYERWNSFAQKNNYGAVINFSGIVRQESEMNKEEDGLYFEIYEPLLVKWFDSWQEKLKQKGAFLCMAHSKGFVGVGQSSFSVSILSSKRSTALQSIEEFVEDFKANAPIWKYDQISHQRFFAKARSQSIAGSGLFGELTYLDSESNNEESNTEENK
ncbi:hypothetical protein CCZ01_02890 [Helicobacter monodelphidis]|nr:hypothetical protein CCZ01_02890 [Helicobacter sp. 15-1451]